MLRDKNHARDFERALMREISDLKIATRKLHNDLAGGYFNPRADMAFMKAMRNLIALAYTDDD